MSQIQENIVVVEVVRTEMCEMLSCHFPVIECPSGISQKMKEVFIFTQWFLTVSVLIPSADMCDYEILTEFEKYITYINSKKYKNIKKTKEMFPYVEGVEKKKRVSKKEVSVGPDGETEKKKRIYKKKEANVEVSDTDGEVVVSEKKKRVSKKEVSVVGSDGEVVVSEKKKRVSKKEVSVVGPDGEVVVSEKKKRILKKKEVVVGVVVSDTDVESGVESGVEKKKRVSKKVSVVGPDGETEKKKKTIKKKEVVPDVVESGVESGAESGVEKKKKTIKKKESITEEKMPKISKKPTQKLTIENQETIAKCMQVLQDMEELEMEE